jgi:prepilin-type N-terminal cleavage/methylation domain-containing protein
MKRTSAFTLIEMLVVISIIAILAAFAVPALNSALVRGQMTGTVNNTHQLYLAAQQMALDGTTNSDPSLGWPGDITSPAAVTTLKDYCDKLLSNNYLTVGDLQKILSAPGTTCTIAGGTSSTAAGGATTYNTITSITNPALKLFKVQENNPSNTIFAETANYSYNTDLSATGKPYADKGFVLQRKGGDAAIFKKAQAKAAASADAAFQNLVGRVPGDADGTAGSESAGNTLPNT